MVMKMKRIIAEDKYSKVVFDDEKDEYIKTFTPSLKKKIKFFLKLRKYPGENTKYISDILNSIGIKTPYIKKFEKYMVITEDVKGISLKEVLDKETDNKRIDILLEKYICIVRRIIENKIYYGDFHFNNFLVAGDELFLLDLEDYKKELFFIFSKKKMLRLLKRKLEKTVSYELQEKGYSYTEIYNRIISGKKIKI